MKFYYFKYRDRVLGKTHTAFAAESVVDRVMEEMAPDGYKRHIVKDLVGDFTLDTVNEMRRKHNYRTPIVY